MENKFAVICDLDDTLGPKTPPFTEITQENVTILKTLIEAGGLLGIATSRPRSLTYQGFAHGGMFRKEVDETFKIGVFEDGLLAFYDGKKKFNALDIADKKFHKMRDAFYDGETIDFFLKNGFHLFPGRELVKTSIDEYKIVSYGGINVGHVETDMHPIYQQPNEVMQVYKPAIGYLDDDMDRLKPIIEKMGQLAREHFTKRLGNFDDYAFLQVWKDAIDLKPVLTNKLKIRDTSIKGHGLECAFEGLEIDNNLPVFICGDGKNDIQMVKWAKKRFPNYHVVSPSNISDDLRTALSQGGYRHTILLEDCRSFCSGLKRVIGIN